MPLDRNAVTRGARDHVRTIQETERRELSCDERIAIRKEHEQIAKKVERTKIKKA